MTIFPMVINDITFMCTQTSFTASSLHPHCYSIIPDLGEAWHQFIMTTTKPLVVQEEYCYFTVQKHMLLLLFYFSHGKPFWENCGSVPRILNH
jgi:hypothetical protein